MEQQGNTTFFTTLKNNWQLILIFILITILFFQWRSNDDLVKYKDKETKNKIEKVEKEKKELQKQIDSLDGKITETKTVINNITKEREVQIKYVDKYTNKELTKYFEERYQSGAYEK